MDIINALIAAGVDLNPQLSARRPEAGSGGRFNDPLLSTGCTPLLDAVIKNDMEVITLLLNKGANPNINAMATTPFLQAAGVGGGGRGGGAPAGVNTALLDLFLAHGADINSQVTGAATYSMKVARSAATGNDGLTALHAAVQSGRVDMVRYLLEKGARTDVADAMGRTPKDLLSAGARGGSGAAAPPLPAAVPAAGGGGRGGGRNAANDPEILALLQSAAAKK
jgi:ankyrin repeat protein